MQISLLYISALKIEFTTGLILNDALILVLTHNSQRILFSTEHKCDEKGTF